MLVNITNYLCPSLDTKGKKLPSPKCTQILNSLHDQKTKGLLTVLPLVEGMPVLLTHNVATELGWSNGTSAHVCAIKLSEHDKNTKIDRITIKGMTVSVMQLENCPDYVLVENKSGRHEQLDGLSPTQFPITPRHDHFCTEIKIKHGRKFRLNVARTQIPLVPGFAWTIHKAQGKTLGAVIVDLWSQRASKDDLQLAYVALSRVKNLEDVLVLRNFNFARLKGKMNHELSQEFERMVGLANKTYNEMGIQKKLQSKKMKF